MSHTVYLAGPITGQTLDGANNWRKMATNRLNAHGIEALDPLRGKEYLNARVEEDGKYHQLYDEHPMSTAHGITHRDRWDATRSDLLLAYFPEDAELVSIGTCMEIAWANGAQRYVLTVIEGSDNNIHWHAMIREASSLVLDDLDHALSLVPVILGPGIRSHLQNYHQRGYVSGGRFPPP